MLLASPNPPKIHPTCLQNRSPEIHAIFQRFLLDLDVFLSSISWKLTFRLDGNTIFEVFAKSIFLQLLSVLASKNLPNNCQKPNPNHERIDAKIDWLFIIDFLGVRPRFWKGLGSQVGSKIDQNACFDKDDRSWETFLMKTWFPKYVLQVSGLDFEGPKP